MKPETSDAAASPTWRVGALARRLGTTIRALHYYEQFGLVSPRRDEQSGHRIYRAKDVRRLQKVQLLRTLGLSLGQIRDLLKPTEVSLVEILCQHKARLRRQIAGIRRVVDRLDALEAYVEPDGADATEAVFSLLETMMDFEEYYTEEQLAELAKRREALGEEGMQKGQQDWQDLITEVRAAIEGGMPPDSPTGQELARRWEALIQAFTGGNPAIRQSLAGAYRAQPGAMEQFGMDPTMMEWIGQAGVKR